MQNNMPSDLSHLTKPEEPKEKPPFKPFVEAAVAEGITGGIFGFIQKNNIKLSPGQDCKVDNPFTHFVGIIMSEYLPDPKDYPLDSSLRAKVDELVNAESITLHALYANGEIDILRGLARVIGGTAVVETLEGEREKVLKTILDIRGV